MPHRPAMFTCVLFIYCRSWLFALHLFSSFLFLSNLTGCEYYKEEVPFIRTLSGLYEAYKGDGYFLAIMLHIFPL